MNLLQSVKKMCKHHGRRVFVRERLVDQIGFMSKKGYFKRAVSLPVSAKKSPEAFNAFLDRTIQSKKFSKSAEPLILHALAVTLLIALGDSQLVRKKIGRALQTFLKMPKLALAFEGFPNLYAAFLAHLPPVKADGRSVTSLLVQTL